MTLKERIFADFRRAFREKNLEKKEVLSLLNSEIKNREIELGKKEQGLGDQEVVELIKRAIKQRKEAVIQYRNAGRKEAAEAEEREISILSLYLPEQLSSEEVEKEVRSVIKKIGAVDQSDIGRIIGAVMAKLGGRAEGKEVKKIVENILADPKE